MNTVLQWLAFVAVLWPALAISAEAQWPLGREAPNIAKPSESAVAVTGCGRFQVFVSPHVKGHTFMLDTDTGRVWSMKKDATTGDFSFQRIPVDDLDGPKTTAEPEKAKGQKRQPTEQK
jgi:hypothetical protein